MIYFNDTEHAEDRANTKALTLQEEEQAVAILNKMIRGRNFGERSPEEALIQRFVNHYQNLCHYHAYTYKGEVEQSPP